jgi:hypothetical protein
VVVVGERYWVSDVWAWGQNGRKKNRDKFACPVCCAAIIFLGLIYVCVNGPLVIVSVNLCVWCCLTARFMRLGCWKGVDRLTSPYRLKNIATHLTLIVYFLKENLLKLYWLVLLYT